MSRREVVAVLVVVVVAVLVVGAWWFAWVRPHDAWMRAVEECMDGDAQRYDACAEEVSDR